MLVLIFVRYRPIFPAGEFLKTVLKYNAEKRKFTFSKKGCRLSFTGRRRALDIEEKRFLGGFPLSRNFHVRRQVNKIEGIHGKSRVNVTVEPRSTFTFPRGLSYIAFMLFTRECSHHKIVPDGASVHTVISARFL